MLHARLLPKATSLHRSVVQTRRDKDMPSHGVLEAAQSCVARFCTSNRVGFETVEVLVMIKCRIPIGWQCSMLGVWKCSEVLVKATERCSTIVSYQGPDLFA